MPQSTEPDVQLEKGYVRLANNLLTAIAHAPWESGGQPRMVLALVRATYGLQRRDADLGTSAWRSLTGLSNRQIVNLRKQLTAEGVFVLVRDFDARKQRPQRWRLQKNFTKWGRFAPARKTVEELEAAMVEMWKTGELSTPDPVNQTGGGELNGGRYPGEPDGGTLPPTGSPGTARKSLKRKPLRGAKDIDLRNKILKPRSSDTVPEYGSRDPPRAKHRGQSRDGKISLADPEDWRWPVIKQELVLLRRDKPRWVKELLEEADNREETMQTLYVLARDFKGVSLHKLPRPKRIRTVQARCVALNEGARAPPCKKGGPR